MATMQTVFDALGLLINTLLVDAGIDARVYAGPSEPGELFEDLRNNISHVSIMLHGEGKRLKMPITERVLIQEPDVQIEVVASSTQLQGGSTGVSATGTMTFSGPITAGLNLLFAVNDNIYVPYHPAATLTLNEMVAGFAVAINAKAEAAALVTASAVGAVLTVTAVTPGATGNALPFWVRLGGTGQMKSRVRYQKDEFHIMVNSASDSVRALISDKIDLALEQQTFLAAEDEPPMRVMYKGRIQTDVEIRLGVYRRILCYTVEYNMTDVTNAFTVLEGLVTVEAPE